MENRDFLSLINDKYSSLSKGQKVIAKFIIESIGNGKFKLAFKFLAFLLYTFIFFSSNKRHDKKSGNFPFCFSTAKVA